MSDSLGFMISDIARRLRREFDSKARGIGVTRPQWRVITLLTRHEGIHQCGLAELLEVEPITASRMVDRLGGAGLVERRPDPADRRAWRLYLTDASRALLGDLHGLADDLFADALAGFSAEERAQLFGHLERLRANLSPGAGERLAANG